MRSDNRQTDIFRDDPKRLIEAWRAQAETSRQQFPDDERRADYYSKRIEELEKLA